MSEKSTGRVKATMIILSIVLVAASLAFPAFTVNDYDGLKSNRGLELFFMGGFAILGGGFMEWIVWLANPLYLIGLVFFIRSRAIAKSFSSLAFVLALSFAAWTKVLAAESGRTAPITERHLGYWLWTGGIALLMIGSHVLPRAGGKPDAV